MKNRAIRHNFRAYDTEDIGQGVTWVKVECQECGEQRTIGAPIAEVNSTGGCTRKGKDDPWQKGDLLIIDGRLDYFECILGDGRILTYNAGGSYYTSNLSDVRVK